MNPSGWVDVLYRTNPNPPKSIKHVRREDYQLAILQPLAFSEFEDIFDVVEMFARPDLPNLQRNCRRPIRAYDVICLYQSKPEEKRATFLLAEASQAERFHLAGCVWVDSTWTSLALFRLPKPAHFHMRPEDYISPQS